MQNYYSLFVVGAGASKEANLPTGSELKSEIARLVDIRYEHGSRMISGDNLICDALKIASKKNSELRGDINPYLHAGWRIRDAMPMAISIDNFIDSHRGDKKIELCGKLAIVRSILAAEKASHLYVDSTVSDPSLNFMKLEKTWYNSFWQLLTENCPEDQLSERLERVSLIVFNYDRCIEHYLYHALQTYYGMFAKKAGELVKSIAIYHPYGVVGQLPWMQPTGGIAFGGTPSSGDLSSLASQIKTFTEGSDPHSSEILQIRHSVRDAQVIVFLGFGFHKLNMDLIELKVTDLKVAQSAKSYFGTAKGISDSDCKIIEEQFLRGVGPNQHQVTLRNDLGCAELIGEYWRRLTFS